jgi:hypothetical protein
MKRKIRQLREFVHKLSSDLNKIGDEFANIEEVIRKQQLYIFEKDEVGYWFNSPDGEFSGIIAYDESNDSYYVARNIQIYDDIAKDWGYDFDLGCSRLVKL